MGRLTSDFFFFFFFFLEAVMDNQQRDKPSPSCMKAVLVQCQKSITRLVEAVARMFLEDELTVDLRRYDDIRPMTHTTVAEGRRGVLGRRPVRGAFQPLSIGYARRQDKARRLPIPLVVGSVGPSKISWPKSAAAKPKRGLRPFFQAGPVMGDHDPAV